MDDVSLNLRGHYAGFITRALAFILDLLIIVTAVFVVSFIFRLVITFLGIPELIGAIPLFASVEDHPVRRTLFGVSAAFLLNAIFFSCYQVFFWLTIGKSPGKALVGLRVVPENGGKLRFRQAVVRALGYYISGIVFFLGFLAVLVHEDRQAWHDRLANTYVLYDWDARLGRQMLARLGITRPDLFEPSPGIDRQAQVYTQQTQQQRKPT